MVLLPPGFASGAISVRTIGTMASNPHILVVDDERDIRDPIASYLDKNGLRVTTAANAAAAREILAVHAIDLVLLDIMMPGEDGLSLAAFIRSTTRTPLILQKTEPETFSREPRPWAHQTGPVMPHS